jgi:hypothetical protein
MGAAGDGPVDEPVASGRLNASVGGSMTIPAGGYAVIRER